MVKTAKKKIGKKPGTALLAMWQHRVIKTLVS